jgi:hypothetical protein
VIYNSGKSFFFFIFNNYGTFYLQTFGNIAKVGIKRQSINQSVKDFVHWPMGYYYRYLSLHKVFIFREVCKLIYIYMYMYMYVVKLVKCWSIICIICIYKFVLHCGEIFISFNKDLHFKFLFVYIVHFNFYKGHKNRVQLITKQIKQTVITLFCTFIGIHACLTNNKVGHNVWQTFLTEI